MPSLASRLKEWAEGLIVIPGLGDIAGRAAAERVGRVVTRAGRLAISAPGWPDGGLPKGAGSTRLSLTAMMGDAIINRLAIFGATGDLTGQQLSRAGRHEHPGESGGHHGRGSGRPFGPEHATSYGVVDEIARRVWLNGGRVLAVRKDDVPGQGVAAILRYAA